MPRNPPVSGITNGWTLPEPAWETTGDYKQNNDNPPPISKLIAFEAPLYRGKRGWRREDKGLTSHDEKSQPSMKGCTGEAPVLQQNMLFI
jgi:hypothetical protein